MSETILLEIVSPLKLVYKHEVESLVVPGSLGQMGILPHHAAIVSGLEIGVVKVKVDGTEFKMAISGGFLEVANNKAVILAETAETEEEIDLKRAEEAKTRAEMRLSKQISETDIQRAELALKRALARINTVRG